MMKVEFGFFQDKIIKIFLLIMILAPALLFHYISKSFDNHDISLSSEIDISFDILYNYALFLTAIFVIGLSSMSSAMQNSIYNNTHIEKKLEMLFSKVAVFKKDRVLYYLSVMGFSGFVTYLMLDATMFMTLASPIYQGVDLITIDKNEFFDIGRERPIFLMAINFTFLFLLLISTPKKINISFLFGLLGLPFIAKWCFGIDFRRVFKEVESLPVENNDIFESLVYWGYPIFFVFFLFLLFFIFSYYNHVAKPIKSIRKKMHYLIGGYVTSVIISLISVFAFLYSPTVTYFNSDLNVKNIVIHDQTYKINLSLTSEQENDVTEYMIESYVGLSMHLASPYLEDMLSGKYPGDKIKAIKLSAYILIENLKKHEEKRAKVVNFMKTEKIRVSHIGSLLIPFVIYEASPLHHQERAIEHILLGEYQRGVDAYLEDAVNRETEESLPLKMTDQNVQVRTYSYGHPVLQSIISSLVRNKLATVDFGKVNNDKQRDRLKEIIKNGENSYSYMPTNEMVDEWNKVFKIDKL